jgi:hypothetical protein
MSLKNIFLNKQLFYNIIFYIILHFLYNYIFSKCDECLNICFAMRCEDWLTLDLFIKNAIKDRIQ